MGEVDERGRREKYKSKVEYSCEECGLKIKGHSGDPQEAPWLYCPQCDEEMELEVDY